MTARSVRITGVEMLSAVFTGSVPLGAELLTKCAAPVPARAAARPSRAGTDVTDGRLLRLLGALAER
jgi:hypothetical protein